MIEYSKINCGSQPVINLYSSSDTEKWYKLGLSDVVYG